TQEVEADASGVLLKIAVEGGEVDVGRTIAVIGEEGEEVPVAKGDEASAADNGAGQAEPAMDTGPEDVPKGQSPGPVRSSDGGRIKASPLARRIAREQGVDLASGRGTGPDGRIVAEDVERGATAAPATTERQSLRQAPPGQVEVRQLSNVRKTIARRLTRRWEARVSHLVVSADMRQALALVERLRELHPDERPTVTDVLT